MNGWDVFLLLLIGAAVALAIVHTVRAGKSGRLLCGGDCSSCGGPCGSKKAK